MNEENQQEKAMYIPCMECWRISNQKNPPIMGEMLPGGRVWINRAGLDLLIEGTFSLICRKCGSVLNKMQIREEEIEGRKIFKYVFEGLFLGGTA